MMDAYIDGASLGNPGEAGIGIVFADGPQTVKNISRPIGRQTNNVAEYTALVFALQEALLMRVKRLRVFSDSELLCRQMTGAYKVKSDGLRPIFEQARHLTGGFERFEIKHIPREQNKGADKLARLGAKKNKTQPSKPDMSRMAASSLREEEESPSSRGQRSG